MKTIQILISELKVWRESVDMTSATCCEYGQDNDSLKWDEISITLSLLIQKLTLLLSDKHTEAITEEAHSANTMLGEVCPCCKRPTSETYRASSSETAVVGQNLDKLKPEE